MPRDARPPNPLGIYDMYDNGWEWMNDWYEPEYYKYSSVKDSRGPVNPVFKDYQGNFTKVVNSQDFFWFEARPDNYPPFLRSQKPRVFAWRQDGTLCSG